MWLIVMVVAVSLLAIVLFIPNCVSAYRRLKHAGAPRPALILWKQYVGLFVGGRRKTVPVLIENYGGEYLRNTLVWLAWDIRWIGSGTGLGKVVDIIHNTDYYKLVVQVFEHIHFTADDNGFSEVIFEPHNPIALIKRNKLSSIYGRLETPDELQKFNITGVITCELSTLN